MVKANFKRETVVLLVISVVLFLADFLGFLSGIHYRFEKSKAVWQRKLWGGDQVSVNRDKDKQLAKQLASCRLRVLQLEEENRASRRLLEADLPAKLDYQTAHLLGKSNDSLELDVGENQGVFSGAAVLAGDVLIGRITKVSGNVSWVKLLTSRDSKEIVGIWRNKEGLERQEAALTKGLLVGGESLMVEEVLAHEEVEEGDLVASNLPPARFLIGQVEKVWISEDGLYKKVLVKPFEDLNDLSSVFVVKAKKKKRPL
jgi:cell shape-determining protein MreC